MLSEVVKGDFHEGKTTWTGTLLNVGVGLIPYVGQAADARDTAAAAKNLWNEPSWGNAGMMGLAVVGWVPLIGDAVKGGAKVGRTLAKDAAKEALEKTAKEGLSKVEKEIAEKATKEGTQKAEKAAVEKAATEAANRADDTALDEAFKGGKDEGAFDTAERLKRGNLGEKLATEWLGAEGHKILSYKPSILERIKAELTW